MRISKLCSVMVQSRNPADASAFASSPCTLSDVNVGKSFTLSTQRYRPHQYFRRRPRSHSLFLSVTAKASLAGPAERSVEWLTTRSGKVNELLDFSNIDVRSRLGVSVSQEKRTVLKGTELAEFPEGTFLTPGIAKKLVEKKYGVATDESLSLGDESLLALCLLVERARRDSSEYAGLLEALPGIGELDSPDFWSDEELQMLRGSPVYSKSMEIRQAIEQEWKNLNSALFEGNRKLFPEEDFSFEKYKWALGVVDSRTVSAGSEEARVLAPVLVNLRPPVGSRKATGRVEMSGGMFFSKKRIVLVADVDMAGGEEVSVSSGEESYQSDQLVERGVVVEDGASKWEVCFQLTRLDRFYDDKIDIVEMAGLEGRASFDMLEADKNGKWEAPEDMESFLRLLCLSGADAFLLEGVFRGEVWGFMGLPVSEENEKAMCELMIGTCEDALEEYEQGSGEGCEDDEVWRRRREMAERVVEGEKKILMAAVKTYQGRLKTLDAVEYYAERRLKGLDLLRPVDESEIVDSESGGRIGRAFDDNYL